MGVSYLKVFDDLLYDLFSISNAAYIMQLIRTFDKIKGVPNVAQFLWSFATKKKRENRERISNVSYSLKISFKSYIRVVRIKTHQFIRTFHVILISIDQRQTNCRVSVLKTTPIYFTTKVFTFL